MNASALPIARDLVPEQSDDSKIDVFIIGTLIEYVQLRPNDRRRIVLTSRPPEWSDARIVSALVNYVAGGYAPFSGEGTPLDDHSGLTFLVRVNQD